MKLERWRDYNNRRHFKLEVDEVDLVKADFTRFDYALFSDVEQNAGDRGTPVADWLLAIETMARRIEEAK